MKGLLLKDWYEIKNYCRATIVLIAAFSIIGGIEEENSFFTYYAYILAGILVMNLFAYEEKEKWDQYAATLPYTKTQMVSIKYFITLCVTAITILLNILTQLIYMILLHAFATERLLLILLISIPLALGSAAILLPCIYKFGVNKGRIVYCVVLIALCCSVSMLTFNPLAGLSGKSSVTQISVSVIVFAVSLAVYAFSWALSIHFYKNREF